METTQKRESWNKGKLVGQKPPLKPKDGTKKGRDLLSRELSRNRLTCLTDENFGENGKLNVDMKIGKVRSNIDHICMTDNAFRVVRVGAWNKAQSVVLPNLKPTTKTISLRMPQHQ